MKAIKPREQGSAMSGIVRVELLRDVEEFHVLGSEAAEVDDLSPGDITGKSLLESGASYHEMFSGRRLMEFVTRDGLVAIELQAKFQFARNQDHRDGQPPRRN